jgi:two-component system phosphate regulon sensor histidine kinase PhoR
MKLAVRGKLFLVSVAVVLLVVVTSGLVAEREIRTFLVARIEAELLRDARAGAAMMQRMPAASSLDDVDARADDLGRAFDARVTFVSADGSVIGDSQLTLDELRVVEDHGNRPEVRDARHEGKGSARRFSQTLRIDMLYVAVPFSSSLTSAPTGVVRVATPLHDVEAAVARMRALLAVAFAVGVGVAIAMSALASHWMSRALRALVEHTHQLASGSSSQAESMDEIVSLTGTFQRLSADLSSTVAALAEERDRFAAVLEAMREAVIAVDHAQRIVIVNEAARTIFPIEADARGRPLVDVVRTPSVSEAAARALAGESCGAEVTLGADSPLHLSLKATPTRAQKGAVLVFHDVTELVRLERVRRDFVANVSHELRTPVSVIVANSETLLDGALDDPKSARNFVEGIARHATRLSRLIADLLDLARIEAGRLQLEIEDISVLDAVTRASDGLRSRARDKGLTLEIDVDPALHARADAKAIDQVLTNLLENAVKYTPAPGRVRVRAARDDEMIAIDVEDDGPGIPPEHRARLFERFYRVDTGRSRELGGTGLGLSIVKHLTEAMHGDVSVHPVDPHGSRFRVRLPCQRP